MVTRWCGFSPEKDYHSPLGAGIPCGKDIVRVYFVFPDQDRGLAS